MSEELKEVIGRIETGGGYGWDIKLSDLSPENRRRWEIGKKACEAEEWHPDEVAMLITAKATSKWTPPMSAGDRLEIAELVRDGLHDGYAAGLAAAKPTGWRVEIASIQERPLSPERLWKCELYNHDTSILSWSIPHTSKAGLKQYLKPLIDFLHAEVRVMPMEKKGQAE